MKPIEEKLEHVSKSTPDLPLHRAHLRRTLLASKHFEGSNISFMKKLLPVGLVLALLITLNAVQKPDSTIQITPKASAQELVNQVLENVKKLTAEDLLAIQENGSLPSDQMLQILVDAVKAPDLDYMGYEPITCKEATQLIANGIPAVTTARFTVSSTLESSDGVFVLGDGDGCTSAYKVNARSDARFPNGFSEVHSFEGDYVEAPLTYLEYTNSNGDHVYLGLSEDLIPVYAGNISDMVFAPGFDFTGASWLNISDDGEGGLTIQTNAVSDSNMSTYNPGVRWTAPTDDEIYFSETNHADSSEETPQGDLNSDENGCSTWTSPDGQMGGGGC